MAGHYGVGVVCGEVGVVSGDIVVSVDVQVCGRDDACPCGCGLWSVF